MRKQLKILLKKIKTNQIIYIKKKNYKIIIKKTPKQKITKLKEKQKPKKKQQLKSHISTDRRHLQPFGCCFFFGVFQHPGMDEPSI